MRCLQAGVLPGFGAVGLRTVLRRSCGGAASPDRTVGDAATAAGPCVVGPTCGFSPHWTRRSPTKYDVRVSPVSTLLRRPLIPASPVRPLR